VNLRRPARNAGELSLTKIIVCAAALSLYSAENLRTSAQGRKSEKEDGYTIRGTVVNSVTKAAIGRALVNSTDNRFAKMTDDQGHFEFKVLLHESGQTRPFEPVAGSSFFDVSAAASAGVLTRRQCVLLSHFRITEKLSQCLRDSFGRQHTRLPSGLCCETPFPGRKRPGKRVVETDDFCACCV